MVHRADSRKVGRITPAGTVTTFSGVRVNRPWDLTEGPDRALWFTNSGNSTIGRITTSGVVSNFGGGHISNPLGIAAGPDRALWFTNSTLTRSAASPPPG